MWVGWRRIVNIDISAGDDCPSGWRKETYSETSYCRINTDDGDICTSAIFSTYGTSYQRVCGRAKGYQKGQTFAFWVYYAYRGTTIDGIYADGLSITYGNPHQHIWTYTCGEFNSINSYYNFPCADGGWSSPPFVGTNYNCESGATNVDNYSAYYFNDPLWDRSGCITSNCCTALNQPQFYSDIEARRCNEGTGIGKICFS